MTIKDNAAHVIFIALYECSPGSGRPEKQLLSHAGARNPPGGIALIS